MTPALRHPPAEEWRPAQQRLQDPVLRELLEGTGCEPWAAGLQADVGAGLVEFTTLVFGLGSVLRAPLQLVCVTQAPAYVLSIIRNVLQAAEVPYHVALVPHDINRLLGQRACSLAVTHGSDAFAVLRRHAATTAGMDHPRPNALIAIVDRYPPDLPLVGRVVIDVRSIDVHRAAFDPGGASKDDRVTLLQWLVDRRWPERISLRCLPAKLLAPNDLEFFGHLQTRIGILEAIGRPDAPPEEIASTAYSTTRSLLQSLRVLSPNDHLPAVVARWAEIVFAKVLLHEGGNLPEGSAEALKTRPFSLLEAHLYTGEHRNTCQKRLKCLQEHGLAEYLGKRACRKSGSTSKHYQFAGGVGPPFGALNPFAKLPLNLP